MSRRVFSSQIHFQWNGKANARPPADSRVQRKSALHHLNAFTHVDQPQTASRFVASPRLTNVEPTDIIAHAHPQDVILADQGDPHVVGVRVFSDIGDGLL